MSPIFRHNGFDERDWTLRATVVLGPLLAQDVFIDIAYEHAHLVGVGYVLEHDREQIQIIDDVRDGRARVARAFAGTRTQKHPLSTWTVVAVPQKQELEDVVMAGVLAASWKCDNCGGPNVATTTCKWCGK